MDDSDTPPEPPPPRGRLLRPDGLPHVLYAEDAARFFGVSLPTARRNLAGGRYGPSFRLAKRWAIRADALLAFLKRVEEQHQRPEIPVRDKRAAKWARRLAEQRRRRKA